MVEFMSIAAITVASLVIIAVFTKWVFDELSDDC